MVANGVYPAPPLVGYKGGSFSLTVKNELNDNAMDLPTSIVSNFHVINYVCTSLTVFYSIGMGKRYLIVVYGWY